MLEGSIQILIGMHEVLKKVVFPKKAKNGTGHNLLKKVVYFQMK